MKLFRALLQETMESVDRSSTISNVFVKKGGGPTSCKPCIGCAEKVDEDEHDDDGDDDAAVVSSSFTFCLTLSMQMPSENVLYLQKLGFVERFSGEKD